MNISLSINEETVKRLDAIAAKMDRTRSWVAAEAMEQYLNYHEWFVQSVQEALADADAGIGLVPHEEVIKQMDARIERLKQRL